MKKILAVVFISLIAVAAFAQMTKELSRSSFTTAVQNREPVDQISSYTPAENGAVFFFTELKNMEESVIHHIWYKNGESVYDFSAPVNGPRWRTYSSMKAEHFKAGDDIKVEIVDDEGVVYATETLTIN